jgi:hypothetical protein
VQDQNNKLCKRCGKPILSGDPRQNYCDQRCYRGGEFKIDCLKRMASAAVPGTCVEWPHARNKAGYGVFGGGLVSRTVYKLFVGPLDDDECVLHRCDTPACMNPHCLFKGSREDNNKDRMKKERSAVGLGNSQCKLTPEQVKDIFDNWRPYENGRELAEKYGVGMMQIRYIGRGLSQWHLLDPEEVKKRRDMVRVNSNRGRKKGTS